MATSEENKLEFLKWEKNFSCGRKKEGRASESKQQMTNDQKKNVMGYSVPFFTFFQIFFPLKHYHIMTIFLFIISISRFIFIISSVKIEKADLEFFFNLMLENFFFFFGKFSLFFFISNCSIYRLYRDYSFFFLLL